MSSITAVVLTRDEAVHIVQCIESLRDWTARVVVLDSHSHDQTCELARRAGALVIQRPWDHFAAQRQAALQMVAAEWILFIDADERATDAFAREVVARLKQDQMRPVSEQPVGYWLPRRNFIMGQEVRHGGYYPDYQLRLLKRGKAHYDLRREVHETAQLDGPEAFLSEPILHYNYQSWAQFHSKQRFYSTYEAQILNSKGIYPRPHNFVLQPSREFWRRFIALQGWRDGWRGLQLALLYGWYYGFVPYWLLLQRR